MSKHLQWNGPTCLALALAWCFASPTVGSAQHADHAPPAAHADHVAPTAPTVPPETPNPAEHAAHSGHTAVSPDAADTARPPLTDADRAAAFPDLGGTHMDHAMLENPLNKLVLLDRFEWQDAAAGDVLRWDLDTWIGRDLNKLWIRTEGERLSGDTEHAELELLWGKSFARWWDFVAGARRDFEPGPEQSWAAVGVRGLAPYRFDIAATAYVGDGGHTTLRLETEYDVLITNRLILQPRLDVDWYGQSDPARGIGAGLASAELGLRLRYELRREVAPYVGLVRERRIGRTATLVQAAGGDPEDTRFVAGIRLWF